MNFHYKTIVQASSKRNLKNSNQNKEERYQSISIPEDHFSHNLSNHMHSTNQICKESNSVKNVPFIQFTVDDLSNQCQGTLQQPVTHLITEDYFQTNSMNFLKDKDIIHSNNDLIYEEVNQDYQISQNTLADLDLTEHIEGKHYHSTQNECTMSLIDPIINSQISDPTRKQGSFDSQQLKQQIFYFHENQEQHSIHKNFKVQKNQTLCSPRIDMTYEESFNHFFNRNFDLKVDLQFDSMESATNILDQLNTRNQLASHQSLDLQNRFSQSIPPCTYCSSNNGTMGNEIVAPSNLLQDLSYDAAQALPLNQNLNFGQFPATSKGEMPNEEGRRFLMRREATQTSSRQSQQMFEATQSDEQCQFQQNDTSYSLNSDKKNTSRKLNQDIRKLEANIYSEGNLDNEHLSKFQKKFYKLPIQEIVPYVRSYMKACHLVDMPSDFLLYQAVVFILPTRYGQSKETSVVKKERISQTQEKQNKLKQNMQELFGCLPLAEIPSKTYLGNDYFDKATKDLIQKFFRLELVEQVWNRIMINSTEQDIQNVSKTHKKHEQTFKKITAEFLIKREAFVLPNWWYSKYPPDNM
eukprot:403356912